MRQPTWSYIYLNKSAFIGAGEKQQHPAYLLRKVITEWYISENNKKAHLSQNKYPKNQMKLSRNSD